MVIGGLALVNIESMPEARENAGDNLRPTTIQMPIDNSYTSLTSIDGDMYGLQWYRNYGTLSWWSARYEGPQPIGDADNDGKNELLVGGRDPFMRVMKWNENSKTYIEQAKIVDPVFGLGYGVWLRIGNEYRRIPEPFGSATGFAVGDITNDGKNEIGVAWGRHFSAFEWTGFRYKKIGMYEIAPARDEGWDSTLDCIIGDADNDGNNEVVVTGGYSNPDIPEVLVLGWDNQQFIVEHSWDSPDSWASVYFPWIEDVDEDGQNEIIIGPRNKLVVLDWDGNEYIPTTIKTYDAWTQVFGCIAKDSDGDEKPEIHVTFGSPDLEIWKWNGTGYQMTFNQTWPNEPSTIEAIDIGDVDNDGFPEVCCGTDIIHILQWDGTEYNEEALIDDTFGCLSVTAVGDCDNDGQIEINAGSVWTNSEDDPYMEWVFKFGWDT
jgi:hypothetical protein